jgi:tetratricopeptide (TPR) repeat protein/predicted Ser/Thr protein kinase
MSSAHGFSDLPPLSDDVVSLESARPVVEALPERIGPYKILGLLGQGGMGVVYRAEQDHPRRTVALKVLKPGTSAERLRRFEQESYVLARLHHPGIAQIYEAGTAESGHGAQPFFAMELLDGKPLTAYADTNQLGPRARLQLLVKVCEAVQHAHQKGVIHRDLKPANILVEANSQPRILDFGVARLTDADLQLSTAETAVGQLIGTVPYMSPEQGAGIPEELDARSDVYTLGVLGYELLAGRLPYNFRGRSLADALRLIQEEDSTPLGSVDKNYRGDLDTIVAKALQKDKTERYQSASELAADINRYLNDEPVLARPATAWYNLAKFARRHRALVGGGAAVLVTLIFGIIATTMFGLKARIQRQRAENAELEVQQRHAQAGTFAMQRGVWREALSRFDDALAAGHPDSAKLRLNRIRAHNSLGDIRSLIAEVEALLRRTDLTPQEQAMLSLWRGNLLLARRGQTEAALAWVKDALAKGLPDAEAEYARALLAENSEQAVEHLRRTLDRDKFHHQAHYQLLLILISLGRIPEARSWLNLSETLFPEDPNFKALRGFVCALEKNKEGAEQAIQQATKRLDPGLGQFLNAVVKALLLLQEVDELSQPDQAKTTFVVAFRVLPVLTELQQAVQRFVAQPEDVTLPFVLPPVLLKSYGRLLGLLPFSYAALRDDLQKPGLFAKPKVLQDYLAKAFTALQQEETVQEFQRAVKAHPEGTLYFVLGHLLLRANRPKEAEEAFLTAAKSPSLCFIERLALIQAIYAEWIQADVHGKNSDRAAKQRMLDNMRRLLALYQQRSDLLVTLVELEGLSNWAWQASDADLARQILAVWDRVQPNSPRALRRRAGIDYQVEAYGPAFEAARKALAQNPTDPEVLKDLKFLVEELPKKLREQADRLGREEKAPGAAGTPGASPGK